ncbi:glycosyltransferase family 2 protein [Flavobacterium sp. RSP49]|uniref:glycosyltransferase family 2 protein n=1 Tax=Flavobacterium sp. RSP49 TaxID=2497487 RepID=UPI000F849397|nr:glycosyltransferase family 2 protein [Flavobacterium sp. RSP49]RTZ02919.1 glycosyltransferase family 2 protein [Flavobacterium sp. RSP49]
MSKLPISAFIISKNEGHLLENCIKSILFCDEIIVVDLESTDNTVEIAKKYGAKVLTIPTIPVGEMIYHKHINITKYKWVLMTDPDEVTTLDLAKDTQNVFHSIKDNSKMGAVFVPIIYFFKSSPLKGTSWGGVKHRAFLFHKERIIIKPIVHTGIALKEGFLSHYIIYNGKNNIDHYWMSGYRQIFEKHLRYLKNEGKSRFVQGYSITLSKILKIPFQQFFNCYIRSRGFKDGFVGLFLSLFRAWYFTVANIELYKYQRKQTNNQSTKG